MIKIATLIVAVISFAPAVADAEIFLSDAPMAPAACAECETLRAENAALKAELARWRAFRAKYEAVRPYLIDRRRFVRKAPTASAQADCAGGACAAPPLNPRTFGIFRRGGVWGARRDAK